MPFQDPPRRKRDVPLRGLLRRSEVVPLPPPLRAMSALCAGFNQPKIDSHQVGNMHPAPRVRALIYVERRPELQRLGVERWEVDARCPRETGAGAVDVGWADDRRAQFLPLRFPRRLDDRVDIPVQCGFWEGPDG